MNNCRQNTKGAYVYASLPVARTSAGGYRTEPRPAITILEADLDSAFPRTAQPVSSPTDLYQQCLDLKASIAKKRFGNARKIRHEIDRTTDSLDSHIGPASIAYGRSSVSVQTGLYLEELKETVETDDYWTQTDQFIDRPPSPLFVPAKVGIDVGTQIEPYDLFDFNIEVRPILEVLVGKTIEQALLEVMEEEELAEIRRQQAVFQEIHNADLAEVERLQERNRRYREEQARRRKQAEHAFILRQQTADKIAARCFVKAYLDPLLPSTFELLLERGYFYDSVQHEIDEFFFTPLLENALDDHVRERRARILMDGIIHEVVEERHVAFRELGRELMEEACVKLVIPKLRAVLANWVFEQMNKLAFARLELAADSLKEIRETFSEIIWEEMLDEISLEVEAQKEAEAAAANEENEET